MEKELDIKMDNIEDFKKFASGITREEFISNYLKSRDGYNEDSEICFVVNNEYLDCPSSLSMENERSKAICELDGNCKQCWMDSVSGIYFKNDIEKYRVTSAQEEIKLGGGQSITYDYNKEYTLAEIFDFPRETKFMSQTGIVKVDVDAIFILDSDENTWEQCYIIKKWLNMKFKLIPKEKGVTFEGVLNSDYNSKCKVEYELIEDLEAQGLDKYMEFHAYMINLLNSEQLDSNDIKDIIRNGQWFIKEC